jgi:biotin transporter BioY
MPVAWKPVPYAIHLFGVTLAGVSILATVVLDGVLSKTKKSRYATGWRIVRLVSFMLIVVGGWITFGSAEVIEWYQLSLLGELMILSGYLLWICVKTYQGEGNRTALSRTLKRIVLVS